MRSNLSNTLSFLAGLAVGAGLEYLLDPDAGNKRRRRLGETSASAVGGLGAALGSVGHRVGSGASHLGEGASHYGSRAAHGTAEAGHKVSDWLSHLPGYFSGAAHETSDRATDLWGRLRSSHANNGHHDGFGAGSVASTAVAAVAVGAILMYALDPQLGRSRRKYAGDQVRGRLHDLGDAARGRAEDARNRLRGYAHEARSAIRTEQAVPDKTLEERIRSALGHVSDQVGQIMVQATNGNVTLRGSAADAAADQLLDAARKVTGVQHVEDQLTRT